VTIEVVIMIIVGYFLGAIPFGLLLGLAKGVDVRKEGSGNIGATNTGRVLGKNWGYLCLALDVLKGFVPVLAMCLFVKQQKDFTEINQQLAMLAMAGAAILGHVFSVFIKFKGGKGVATSLGVLLGIWPYMTITSALAFGVWSIVKFRSKLVSLASIISAISFPIIFLSFVVVVDSWHMAVLWPSFTFSCLVSFMIVFRHRSNIIRLLNGTED
jgi:glycerol-3-phosphate acyltransferase PlsY